MPKTDDKLDNAIMILAENVNALTTNIRKGVDLLKGQLITKQDLTVTEQRILDAIKGGIGSGDVARITKGTAELKASQEQLGAAVESQQEKAQGSNVNS